MSKLARKPIDIKDVEVTFKDDILTVKGKHGELTQKVDSNVELKIDKESIMVVSNHAAFLGLYASLIRNMVIGVTDLYNETLILKGVGYRVSFSNNVLNFNLGYSHPVTYTVPESIKIEVVSPTQIKVTGFDKQLVGQVAAEIIMLRPAKKDPYKQKGIQRERDNIIKKVGKKVK